MQEATTVSSPGSASAAARSPRCAQTLLTKPECHCRACLFEQIAAHAPRRAAVQDVPAIGRPARRR